MAQRDTQVVAVLGALGRFTDRLVRALAVNATAELIETTPIDTGWARANWVPRIGESFNRRAGSRKQAEAGSVSTAEQEAGVASLITGQTAPGQKVFITNNVPYIVFLNAGTSKQAPAGFVQIAILKAIQETLAKLPPEVS